MAGYWPSSLLRFMDQDQVEIHKNAKREKGQYRSFPVIRRTRL